jgi:hypothetical protein
MDNGPRGAVFFLKVERCVYLAIFRNGVFVRFSTGGFKNTTKAFKPKTNHVEAFSHFPKKLKLFPCHFPPSISFIAFLAVSLHEELKNTKDVIQINRKKISF